MNCVLFYIREIIGKKERPGQMGVIIQEVLGSNPGL
jgi:hypothetical protein